MPRLHIHAAAIGLAALAYGPSLADPPPERGAVTANAGANAYSLPSPAGHVVVYLPNDMRSGDTITGMVVTEPAGATDAERRANADTLSGMVVELVVPSGVSSREPFTFAPTGVVEGEVIDVRTVDGEVVARRTPVANRRLRFAIPNRARTHLNLILRNHAADVTYAAAPADLDARPTARTPRVPILPQLAQAGRPISIQGAFDGDAANTQARIGGAPAPVLAESPRQTVVQAPQDASAATDIAITERGRTTRGPLRLARVELRVGKRTLVSGEATTLEFQISGLARLVRPASMTLTANASVTMSGGNSQNVPIDPGAVGRDGVYTGQRTLQARVAGPFDVVARLNTTRATPARDTLYPDALAMNGVVSAAGLLALLAGMDDDEKAALLRATLRALHARLGAATDADTRDWLNGKIAIVEGALDSLGFSR